MKTLERPSRLFVVEPCLFRRRWIQRASLPAIYSPSSAPLSNCRASHLLCQPLPIVARPNHSSKPATAQLQISLN